MAIINPTIFAAGGGVKASLVVSTEKGAVVTAVNGSNVIRGVASEGVVALNLPVAGTWSVTASINGETVGPEDVVVSEEYPVNLNFERIYGISRTVANSSTVWARTDDAVGKTAVASVGTSAGHSDFDNCYPWSEMRRETLSTGDVMVYIPEFWFERKVTNGVETIRIANKAVDGFTKHPGSGKYVGAYKTSSNNKSVRGAAPTVNQTRATMRTNCKSKGWGWGLIDVATNSAIQMLYLVEFADNDSQAKIGRGYCDGNRGALETGSCDSVPNLTGRPAGTARLMWSTGVLKVSGATSWSGWMVSITTAILTTTMSVQTLPSMPMIPLRGTRKSPSPAPRPVTTSQKREWTTLSRGPCFPVKRQAVLRPPSIPITLVRLTVGVLRYGLVLGAMVLTVGFGFCAVTLIRLTRTRTSALACFTTPPKRGCGGHLLPPT